MFDDSNVQVPPRLQVGFVRRTRRVLQAERVPGSETNEPDVLPPLHKAR